MSMSLSASIFIGVYISSDQIKCKAHTVARGKAAMGNIKLP